MPENWCTVQYCTSLPSLFLCSCVMVARTPAACSPPITEIRALGHMYRNLNNVNSFEYEISGVCVLPPIVLGFRIKEPLLNSRDSIASYRSEVLHVHGNYFCSVLILFVHCCQSNRKQCFGTGSAWIRKKVGPWIRIKIQFEFRILI